MPFHRLATARPFLTLGLVVAAWLVLPTAVKTFSRASFFELAAPIPVATSYLRDLQQYWALRLHSNDELVRAGHDLSGALSSFEFAVQQNTDMRAEIERLEAQLHVPAYENYRLEHARVARRDFSGWWQRIIIRKGANFGVTVDAPVIFAGGVVGKVKEVHATTAVVDLVSSQTIRLAGVVEGDTRIISFQGGDNPTFGPPKGVIEFVPLDVVASPAATRRLVTSGFGGVFPAGLTIGEIVRVEPSSDGLFKLGEVKLDERLGSLAEVTVLVPLNP